MNFCEKCQLLCRESVCPCCGAKELREPKKDDFCFLAEKEAMWSQTLREVLDDNGIDSVCVPVLGAAISVRMPGSERHKIYVPYEKHAKANELLAELFDEQC